MSYRCEPCNRRFNKLTTRMAHDAQHHPTSGYKEVKLANGGTATVHIIKPGERYGRGAINSYDSDLVEFRLGWGFFQYFVTTLAERRNYPRGLCLDNRNGDAATVTAESMTEVMEWLDDTGATVAKFQIGKTYTARSFADYDCIFRFKVVKRTAQTIIVDYHGRLYRKKVWVSTRDGEQTEVAKPLDSVLIYATREEA